MTTLGVDGGRVLVMTITFVVGVAVFFGRAIFEGFRSRQQRRLNALLPPAEATTEFSDEDYERSNLQKIEDLIGQARTKNLLDAVFSIHIYNIHDRTFGRVKGTPINLEEQFADVDQTLLADALKRVDGLIAVGEQLMSRRENPEAAVKALKASYPGFDDTTYDRIIWIGRFWAR